MQGQRVLKTLSGTNLKFEFPQDHPRVQYFTRRLREFSNSIIPIVIYYSEIGQKVAKERGTQGSDQEFQAWTSSCPLPVESCRQCLFLPAIISDNIANTENCLSREALSANHSVHLCFMKWISFFLDMGKSDSCLKVVPGKNQNDYGIPTIFGLQENKWTSNFPFPKQLRIMEEEISKSYLAYQAYCLIV